MGHPDTASAQTLIFSPGSVGASINGPGGTAGPLSVNVTSPTPISALQVAGINTSDHTNWLCAVRAGTNTINVYIGITSGPRVTTTTSQLAGNTTYTGSI